MRIGLFTDGLMHLAFPAALEKASEMGIQAIEIGTGNNPAYCAPKNASKKPGQVSAVISSRSPGAKPAPISLRAATCALSRISRHGKVESSSPLALKKVTPVSPLAA